MGHFKRLFAVAAALSALLATGVWAQASGTPLTPEEVKTYTAKIDQIYTEDPLRKASDALMQSAAKGDHAAICRLYGERVSWFQQGRAQAFADIKTLRANGRSTDLVHHAYLRLSDMLDGALDAEAESCAEARANKDETLADARLELNTLRDLQAKALADLAAAQSAGDDLNACAHAGSAVHMNAERLKTYGILEKVYSRIASEDWTPFLSGYAQARSETAGLEKSKATICARVNAPQPAPASPIPQTPVEAAENAYLGKLMDSTLALMDFTLGDNESTCAAAGNALKLLDEAEVQLNADIKRLEAEGHDLTRLRGHLKFTAEQRGNATTMQKRSCDQAVIEDRGEALIAEAEQAMADYEKAQADMDAAAKKKDRVAGCDASRRAVKSLKRVDAATRETMALDGEDLSEADRATMDANLNMLAETLAHWQKLETLTCTQR